MYFVKNYDNDEIIIKKLSKYEKKFLQIVYSYEDIEGYFTRLSKQKIYQSVIGEADLKQYEKGRRIPIWIIQRDLNIKHRSSLSRIIKSLCRKELIYPYGHDMSELIKNNPKWGIGDYAKYLTLTNEGHQVVKILKEREKEII